MSKQAKPTRSERRAARAGEGVYGVDATDAGADSWTWRYLVWARTPDEARARIAAAGFRRRQIERQWTPNEPPPGGLPEHPGGGFARWYRTRLDDDGWTEWEPLPASYRHPPQALAAVDPTVR